MYKTSDKSLKGLEKRSEEIQEIMGQPPHWTLRWGISVIFIIVCCALVASFFMKVTKTLSVSVTISLPNHVAVLSRPHNSKILSVCCENGQMVHKGDTLFVCKDTDTSTDFHLVAPTDGSVSFPSQRICGTEVKANTPFIYLSPSAAPKNKGILCYGFVPFNEHDKIRQGQMVQINLEEDNILKGVVKNVSSVANEKGLYYFEIQPDESSILFFGKDSFNGDIECTANIVVDNERVISKIFPSLQRF